MDKEIKRLLKERERLLAKCSLFLYQFEQGNVRIPSK